MTDAIIFPLPERIRCTACPMVTSSSLLELAPCTMAWLLLDGFWFCEACRSAAPYIVALDSERNAHQVTMLRLDEANDEIDRLRCYDLDAFHAGELTPQQAAAFRDHLTRCAECQTALPALGALDALVADLGKRRDAVVDAAVAWVTADGPIGAIIDAVVDLGPP